MIVKENININGIEYIKTYSNENVYIKCEGIEYTEAIDTVNVNREYTETDKPIEDFEKILAEIKKRDEENFKIQEENRKREELLRKKNEE